MPNNKEDLQSLLKPSIKQRIVEDLIIHENSGECRKSHVLTRLGYSSGEAGGQYRQFQLLEDIGVIIVAEDEAPDGRVGGEYAITDQAALEYADYCEIRITELLDVLDALKRQFGIDRGFPSMDS